MDYYDQILQSGKSLKRTIREELTAIDKEMESRVFATATVFGYSEAEAKKRWADTVWHKIIAKRIEELGV